MKAIVLAYHSHNISGTTYATNDHVAFASDLETLHRLGAQLVPVGAIVEDLARGKVRFDRPRVAFTFDDGPVFDFHDFIHPLHGPQRSFCNAMRDFRHRHGTHVQPGLQATSFVIASPAARRAMSAAEECGYTFLQGWLEDDWWSEAAASGFIEIGNHSWDHVHGALAEVATGSPRRNDFTVVDNFADADREIRHASEFIARRAGAPVRWFAYPFGHVNAYLPTDYLPSEGFRIGLRAGFGTGGRAVEAHDSVWDIPRVVCGHHWHSPDELSAIVTAA